MPATKSLQDLFINLLKDMYYAEKQILKALPKMATPPGLRASSQGDRRPGRAP